MPEHLTQQSGNSNILFLLKIKSWRCLPTSLLAQEKPKFQNNGGKGKRCPSYLSQNVDKLIKPAC